MRKGIGIDTLNSVVANRRWRHSRYRSFGRKEDRKVAMKVANDPQLSPTLLTNHLRSLFGPKTQQDYPRRSTPRISAFNRQHHYTIGIFGIASDLCRTSVIGYQCYQSSDFCIGDYSSLFYFYPLTPTHATPYCSFLSPLSLRSHAHPMTLRRHR